MRAILDRRAFLRGLTAIGWVHKGRPRREEEGRVLVEAHRTEIALTTREDPFHAQAPVAATIREPGRIFVPFDSVRRLVETWRAEKVELIANDDELCLRGGGDTFHLKGFPSAFQDRPTILRTRGAAIDAPALREVMQRVLFAMGDDQNPALGCVRLTSRHRRLRALALSGTEIAMCQAACTNADEGEWLIAGQLARRLADSRNDDGDLVTIAATERALWLGLPNVELTGPAVEATSLPMPRLETIAACQIERSALAELVELLGVVAGADRWFEVKLGLDAGTLRVSHAPSADLRYDPRRRVEHRGTDATHVTTLGPLVEAVKHAVGDHVELAFGDENTPLRVRSRAEGIMTSTLLWPRHTPDPAQLVR